MPLTLTVDNRLIQVASLMEAIVELILAIAIGLAHALVGLWMAIITFFALIVEFIVLALTQGISAASRQFKLRSQERAEAQSSRKAQIGVPASNGVPPISGKQSAILASIVLFVIICIGGTLVIRDRIRKQRIAATQSQVKTLADTFAEQMKDDAVADPEPGKLVNRDAWRQPLELFIDKSLLGSLIVVRSSGPDRKSGSIDDLLAIRVVRAQAKDVGGELAKRGAKALKDRIAGLLGEDAKEPLPENINGGEE
ncbi:MAG TPA: hypothetical protein DDZ51_26255 [Planctomycetaceae bacterium]|nr:hypothetical protein [Planctomycetaceae bacterium]